MDIKSNQVAIIEGGKYSGWYIKVEDDSQNTGGYLILYSRSKDFTSEDGFDDWVENEEGLSGYFNELNCDISWL